MKLSPNLVLSQFIYFYFQTYSFPNYVSNWLTQLNTIIAMRKKPSGNQPPEKGTLGQRAKEQQDFLVCLCYLRRSPRIVQEVFSPYVKALSDHYTTNSTLANLIERLRVNGKGNKKVDRLHDVLFQNFAVLINRYEITMKMVSIRKQVFPVREGADGESKTSYDCAPFPINLVRPKYYLTEVIAKQQAELDIGLRTQNLTDNTSPLYAEPRFYQKLNELVHFKSNKKFKGAILLLEYEGHAITGRRAFAVLNRATVEIWQMNSHIFPFPFAQPLNDYEDDHPSIKSGQIQQPIFSKKYKFVAHTDKVTCASFSSDQLYLLTGGVDRKVKLWCLRLKMLLAQYRNHSKTIWDVHFNPSGYYFLSGSADGLMMLWRTDTAFSQRIFDHGGDVYKVSFAKNPNYAISAGEDCKVKVWHIIEAQVKYCLQLDNPVINFTLGYSGIYIVVIQTDGRVTIFNLLQGIMINTFYFYSKHVRQTSEARALIHDACLSEDERQLTCVTSQHILLYTMDVLQSKRKANVYENGSRVQGSEVKVMPKQIIMISNKMRLNFCGYRDYRLLVVAAASK